MISIWERNSFMQYDLAIIGSGIVGLCTAYYAKRKYPNKRIVIFERGLIPSGASTKNAGFACMGSLTEILDNLDHHSEEEVLSLFMLRKKGLERLQTILSKEQLGYKSNGSYELIMEEDKECIQKIDYCNNLLFNELGVNAFSECNEHIAKSGFNGVHAIIKNNCEGEIDSGKAMANLVSLILSMGVEIKTGCSISHFLETEICVNLYAKHPATNSELVFKAEQLILCNNAFAKHLIPDLDITPGRGQVLITKPIPDLKFKGIYHLHQGYFYFREYHGCVLFGGGRNLDFEGETTTEFGLTKLIQDDLEHKLATIILPNTPFEIDMRWSGIMAFGPEKKPIIKRNSDRVYMGLRMGGMGVAIGSEVAHQLSELI